jgi:tetratricopeptide (TPR) repeat protein
VTTLTNHNVCHIPSHDLADLSLEVPPPNTATAITPEDTSALWQQGLEKYQKQDYQGAIADFTAILTIKPDDALDLLSKGSCLRSPRRF